MSSFKTNFEDDSQGLHLNNISFYFWLHFLQTLIYHVKWWEPVFIFWTTLVYRDWSELRQIQQLLLQ